MKPPTLRQLSALLESAQQILEAVGELTTIDLGDDDLADQLAASARVIRSTLLRAARPGALLYVRDWLLIWEHTEYLLRRGRDLLEFDLGHDGSHLAHLLAESARALRDVLYELDVDGVQRTLEPSKAWPFP